jgi:hypothetical protein
MRFVRWGLVAVAVSSVVLASARWTLLAQERAAKGPARAKGEATTPKGPALSIQDALLRPLDLPFEQETTLEDVRLYLARTLAAQVVLDRAALDRLDLIADDTIQIELKGVRLKVGLQLLLDQVDMTFRVVPEDNLLVLTDLEGSDDTNKRILTEIKALHREFHDIQDALDDLRDLVEEDLGIEPDRPKHSWPLVRLEGRKRSSQRQRPASRHVRSRASAGAGG